MSKLAVIGIRGAAWNWIQDFLQGRSQSVEYGGASSTGSDKVSSGVVQGSVLGPLLFTMFINDLPSVIKSGEFFLFADDGKLLGDASSNAACDLMQDDLSALGEWSILNELPLSLPKCACLHYGCRNTSRTYNIEGAAIQSAAQCQDLGVLRQESLAYDAHIHRTVLRASRLAGMSFRLFASRNRDFMTCLFVAYIRPILEYASPVWSPSGVGLQARL